MAIDLIKGTDRQFSLRVTKKSNGDPKALTDANLVLSLTLPTESGTLVLGTTVNANGSLIAIASAEGGRITVTLGDADTALMKAKDGQDMELKIQEGAGPDFAISKVQFVGELNVKKMLFS